jgi:hypothetical protein
MSGEEGPGRAEPAGTRGARRVELGLAVLAALAAFAVAWGGLRRWEAIDFYQFWIVGRAVARGEAGDVYSQAERDRLGALYQEQAREYSGPGGGRRERAANQRDTLETYSTPWLYARFLPFTDGYLAARTRFQRLSLLAYAAALLALGALAGVRGPPLAILAACGFHVFAPCLEDENLGNVARWQLAELVLALVLLRRGTRPATILAGAVLGQWVLFKPNGVYVVAALGLGWLATRQHRKSLDATLGGLLGAAGAFAASVRFFGSAEPWARWRATLPDLLQLGRWGEGNFSLAQVIHDAFGVGASGAVKALVLVALAAALVACARAHGRGARAGPDADAGLAGLGALACVLASELAWLHYYVLALPIVTALLRASAAPAIRWGGLLAFALIALEPQRQLFGLSYAAQTWSVVAGALLAFALGLGELARGGFCVRDAAGTLRA